MQKKTHGNKYDYSKVEYKNNSTKVCIIYPKHGEFWQTPSNHLKYGCNKCGSENSACLKRMPKEEFIKRATEKHNDKYDYSLVNYTNNVTKVEIICKKCGTHFFQTPAKHLNGRGCRCQKMYVLEKEIKDILKDNGIPHIEQATKTSLPWLDRLSLDFFLPDYNVAIECQGIQHFEPHSFASNISKEEEEKIYNEVIERDNRKKEKCIENGIELLYFSNLGIDYPYMVYEDKKQLIDYILSKNKKQ